MAKAQNHRWSESIIRKISEARRRDALLFGKQKKSSKDNSQMR